MVESIAVNTGYKDIGVPVIVVVRDCYANIVSFAGQPSGIGDVGIFPIAIVPKEMILILWNVLFQRGDISAVRKKDIGTPIPVVVENRYAACHRFGCVLRWRLIVFEDERTLLQRELYRRS
jgi:hypothetical protein